MTRRSPSPLIQLARHHGIQLSYGSPISGERVRASPEALMATLRALGVNVSRVEDAAEALRDARRSSLCRVLEPVVTARAGHTGSFQIRLKERRRDRHVRCGLRLEDGSSRHWDVERAGCVVQERVRSEGATYTTMRVKFPEELAPGYHRLKIEASGARYEALVIASPVRSYGVDGRPDRFWGVFIPLYALTSRSGMGAGNFSDLDRLLEWSQSEGGSVVATLPMLASFLEEPFDPSPYSPVSRLFWNEFFLDISAVPEFGSCSRARRIAGSSESRRVLRSLARSPQVDYRRGMKLRRRVLSELAAFLFSGPSSEKTAFMRHLRANPELERYARFRAVGEKRREAWPRWPARLRAGRIDDGDYDETARRYHLYVQWRTSEQIGRLSREARETGPGLYLDFPLGVHPDGYDVWRERRLFARGASVGAPPDPFFSKGQNWGFPPLQTEALRAQGYGYVRECLRHHMSRAGVLRVDHILGLHRLFWIPDGLPASEGVYVRNRSEELYAILSLESHRWRTLIVGEDLGAVPREVRPAMKRHGVHRTFVLQYELGGGAAKALPEIPGRCLASLNTHDMPTFASYWSGGDIDERVALGLLSGPAARAERARRRALGGSLVTLLRRAGYLVSRKPGRVDVMKALLAWMASSRARGVILNLEDLWGEKSPQNTPGTTHERPNWRRKARYDREDMIQQRNVLAIMRMVNRHRRQESST